MTDIHKHDDNYLDKTISFKIYDDDSKEKTTNHLKKINNIAMDRPNTNRTICTVLGYLWDTETDPYRKTLLLEAAWMGVRMSDKLEKHNIIDNEKYE